MLPIWINKIEVPKDEDVELYVRYNVDVMNIIPHIPDGTIQILALGYWELINKMFQDVYDLIQDVKILEDCIPVVKNDFLDIIFSECSYALCLNKLMYLWAESMAICSHYIKEYTQKGLGE